MHKVIVVGRGLIGSAATKYLAENGDGIACVGPDEPQDRAAHTGVFASHYDEGRMTRAVDPTSEWTITAKNSIDRYADIEQRSGIGFFTPSGYLGIGTPGSDYNENCARSGAEVGVTTEKLSSAEIGERFPFLSVADDADGLVETGTAGHISPRSMVKAQSILAEQAGAELIRDYATAVRATPGGVEVETASGQVLAGERALIATGGFTSACGLSPADLKLTVFGRTVVLVKIEGSLANELSGMPTLIHCASGAYILPPIRYADGHLYLKLGIGTEADQNLHSLHELQNWFKSTGSEENRAEFTAFIKDLIPALNACTEWHTDTCVVTQTESSLPIIDFVEGEKIAVAIGGNGKGAKGADDWGRIAAGLTGSLSWQTPIPRGKLALPAR